MRNIFGGIVEERESPRTELTNVQIVKRMPGTSEALREILTRHNKSLGDLFEGLNQMNLRMMEVERILAEKTSQDSF